MYEKLTKAKYNFDSNQVFSKLCLYIYIYIYIYILSMFLYIGLLVCYTELTHLAQKLKKFRLDEAYDTKLNSNWNPIFTLN